jgi:hypothetical protein
VESRLVRRLLVDFTIFDQSVFIGVVTVAYVTRVCVWLFLLV